MATCGFYFTRSVSHGEISFEPLRLGGELEATEKLRHLVRQRSAHAA
jgi:hypothetical protein